MIKDFAKDILRYIPSRAVPGLFGIIVIPVFTRLFNTDEYGQYIIVTTTIAVMSIIATEWISTSIMRYFAEYEKKLQTNLFKGTIIRIVSLSIITTSLTAFFILFFIRHHLPVSLYYYFNIGLLIFGFGAAFNIMQEMLVIKRKPNQYSFMAIWRQCVCVMIGMVIVSLYNLSVAGMLWGIFIGIIIVLPILFIISFGKFNIKDYSPALRIDMMQYGFPLVATNLGAWLLSLSDRYIIEYFRGSHEVGLYSISFSLADRSIQLIVSLVILSSAPIVMKLWDTKGAAETSLFIRDLTKYYLIITLPAAVGLSLVSEPLLKLLSTQSFHEGHRIMPMIAGCAFLYGFQRNFQLGLLFYKKTQIIMYILLISGLSSIALNFIFVPQYGFIAAGYTALFSYTIFTVLIILYSRKYFVFPFPFKTLLKVVVSTIFMGITTFYILKLNVTPAVATITLSIISGAAVYFMSLIIMKEVSKNIFKNVLMLFNKS